MARSHDVQSGAGYRLFMTRYASLRPIRRNATVTARRHASYMKTSWRWLPQILCVLASLGAVSCGSTRTMYLDDGARGYSISCKGYLNSWQSCLVKAGKICEARGYRTIRSEEYDRMLLIACKEPVAPR